MKIANNRSVVASGAFTLVELLVVISIIAVLAGLAFTGGTAARNAARKAQTANLLNTIKIGIASYQAEYGRLPNPNEETADTQVLSATRSGLNNSDGDAQFQQILMALMGEEQEGDPARLNPRNIVFIELQGKDFADAKQPTRGTASTYLLVDAWRNPIRLALDYDYNNRIDETALDGLTGAVLPTEPLRGQIALWSQGNARDAKDMTPGDLIATWR